MSRTWDWLTDDRWTDAERGVAEKMAAQAVDVHAGVATTIGYRNDGSLAFMVSVATRDPLTVCVVRRLEHDDEEHDVFDAIWARAE